MSARIAKVAMMTKSLALSCGSLKMDYNKALCSQ